MDTDLSDSKINCLSEEIDYYLRKNFDYKTSVVNCNDFAINAKRKKFDLYFRYNSPSLLFTQNTFIIARLIFSSTKKGNGTKLLKFLITLSSRYDFKNIGLEHANVDCKLFGEKLGFQSLESSDDHMIVTVSNLKKVLNNRDVLTE